MPDAPEGMKFDEVLAGSISSEVVTLFEDETRDPALRRVPRHGLNR
jgi:hypothetical protein